MIYTVNKQRKNNVIKEIIAKQGSKVSVPYAIFKVGKTICMLIFFISTVVAIYLSFTQPDGLVWMTLCLIGFIVAMILVIIPASFRSVADRKYLYPWNSTKKEESVVISEKNVEYGFYNKFNGEYYYTYMMKYNQVVRIEYDNNQQLMRIYGPIETRWWFSSDKDSCMDKFKTNPEDRDNTWLEIPTYFDKFEELKNELEEKSRKEIEYVERPFITY